MRERVPCPDIVVYKAIDEVPQDVSNLARLFKIAVLVNKETGATTPRHVPLPMDFYGATDDAAAEKANAWWEAEQDRLDRIAAKNRAAGERLRSARAKGTEPGVEA